ncbi:phosphocholine cytidylyltransferase family protein [Evansella sp. AB-P1]|uniref:phosphocholine cytidylyltransferase family protein n=1 Tax=Evansella sp. AB-P1 TaxID=3037653 RepID=UPI00241D4056|nr:phosphocholine cytidylyltransferase family protein [Evansella sp. AB-P1]MDG5786665.1 phosphocholine cytidylyltransferase family protein [Evansella sp. AB-P1]
MAAGRGTRIRNNIGEMPKCTLPVGEVPLIERTIQLFKKNEIDISIVLGYKHEKIIQIIEKYKINFEINPFYDVTNSIASFWFLKQSWGNEDIILMNADVYIEQETLDLILNEKRSPTLFIDTRNKYHGDFFIKHNQYDELLSYGKDLPISERTGEYIGIAKIKKEQKKEIQNKLDEMINEQKHDRWWEDILYELSDNGGVIHVSDIANNYWGEIDTISDYNKLVQHFMIKY